VFVQSETQRLMLQLLFFLHLLRYEETPRPRDARDTRAHDSHHHYCALDPLLLAPSVGLFRVSCLKQLHKQHMFTLGSARAS
jgi:hypothetical protein